MRFNRYSFKIDSKILSFGLIKKHSLSLPTFSLNNLNGTIEKRSLYLLIFKFFKFQMFNRNY